MLTVLEIFILIAQFIGRVLPFLVDRSRLTGIWTAEYTGKKARKTERVQARQLSSLVWGTIEPITNPSDPTWTFYGLMRDQVLVGIYFAREKLGHWQGSFTMVLHDEDTLMGTYSGFEEEPQKIVGSPYKWTRRRA